MRFFHFPDGEDNPINERFVDACKRRNIEYVAVTPESLDEVMTHPPSRGDLLYRQSSRSTNLHIECLLFRQDLATFYRDRTGPFRFIRGGRGVATLFYERLGLPVPKTVYYLDNDRQRLMESVAAVGGFPVILKAHTGQLGQGVLRVDDVEALYSVTDLMLARGEVSMIMQEFVDHASIIRAVCIGDRVVAAQRVKVLPDDFRSHTTDAMARSEIEACPIAEIPPLVSKTAVAAARALGIEFSGSDFIEAKDGRILLSEVNFPCMHARTEQTSGVPITDMMIGHLADKAKAL